MATFPARPGRLPAAGRPSIGGQAKTAKGRRYKDEEPARQCRTLGMKSTDLKIGHYREEPALSGSG
jgi:hypothetical protein